MCSLLLTLCVAQLRRAVELEPTNGVALNNLAVTLNTLGRADEADDLHERVPYDEATSTRRDVIVYRISGAFFFAILSFCSAVRPPPPPWLLLTPWLPPGTSWLDAAAPPWLAVMSGGHFASRP